VQVASVFPIPGGPEKKKKKKQKNCKMSFSNHFGMSKMRELKGKDMCALLTKIIPEGKSESLSDFSTDHGNTAAL
jgi:hypothetical protein